MEVYALIHRMKTSQNNSKNISRDNDDWWTGEPDV